MSIAVIGAGLAGLTAARAAADAGHEVTVYDKGRGLGGRLATRRTEAGAIDHGARRVRRRTRRLGTGRRGSAAP